MVRLRHISSGKNEWLITDSYHALNKVLQDKSFDSLLELGKMKIRCLYHYCMCLINIMHKSSVQNITYPGAKLSINCNVLGGCSLDSRSMKTFQVKMS